MRSWCAPGRRGPPATAARGAASSPTPPRLELGWLWETLAARRGADPEVSYTARLLASGIERMAQKVGEEAVETAIAAVATRQAPERRGELVGEAADLLYHLLVLLMAGEVAPDEVAQELARRHGLPTRPREHSSRAGRQTMPEPTPRRAVPHTREFLADALTPLAVYRRLARLSPTASCSRASPAASRSPASASSVPGRARSTGSGRTAWRSNGPAAGRGPAASACPAPPLEALRGCSARSSPLRPDAVHRRLRRLLRLRPDPPGRAAAEPAARPLRPARGPAGALRHAGRLRPRAAAGAGDRQRDRGRGRDGGGRARARAAVAPSLRGGRRRRRGDAGAAAGAGRTLAPPSLDGAAFRRAVATAKEHIAAGDIFQVVLARRFRLPRRIEPLALYRAVRHGQPEPLHGAARDAGCGARRRLARDAGAEARAGTSRPGRSPAPGRAAWTPTATAASPRTCSPTPRSAPST